jgi:hypothetical protein
MTTTALAYGPGSIIRYSPFGGGIRTVLVTSREDDVKNGRPGFDGHLVGDHLATVWGYDDQITEVTAA